MVVVLRDKLVSDSLDIVCMVDGVPLETVIGVSYEQTVNSARIVRIRLGGIDSIHLIMIGGKVVLKGGRNETVKNLNFKGIILQTVPSYTESEIVAVDYITFLQTSEVVEYKQQDLIGEDLYYLAAVACNYKDIDTTNLIEGSGIKATADINLAGLQTRRQFIEKCFRHLVEIKVDTSHPEPIAVRWRYGIRRDNIMDFWLEDPTNFKVEPIVTLSEHSDNLIGPGLVSKIDSTQLVNSATFQSSNNLDLYATITDNDSVAKYGVHGKLHRFNTDRYDRLEELAYETVLMNKEPTLTYRIVMSNGEHISIGDYIRIRHLSFDKDIILPVVEVTHQLTETIESIIVVGTPELSTGEYIASLL